MVSAKFVNIPTRGSNILDIFVINRPSLIESYTVVDGISDHEVVLTKSLIQAESCPPARRHIYLWSKPDFNHILDNLCIQSLCKDFVSTFSPTTPISTLWNKISNICNRCLKLIPSKWSPIKQNQPWITQFCHVGNPRGSSCCIHCILFDHHIRTRKYCICLSLNS